MLLNMRLRLSKDTNHLTVSNSLSQTQIYTVLYRYCHLYGSDKPLWKKYGGKIYIFKKKNQTYSYTKMWYILIMLMLFLIKLRLSIKKFFRNRQQCVQMDLIFCIQFLHVLDKKIYLLNEQLMFYHFICWVMH